MATTNRRANVFTKELNDKTIDVQVNFETTPCVKEERQKQMK